MGLENKFTFGSCCDCKIVEFTDTTGDWDLVKNQTGFGEFNPPSSGVIGATIRIQKPGSSDVIQLVFTILNNVITDAVRIDQYGDSSNIFSQLNTTDFPFYNLELNTVMLFETSEQVDFEAGAWNVNYVIIYDPETEFYESEAWSYLTCTLTACSLTLCDKLASGDVSSSDANEFFLKMDMLSIAIAMENKDQADHLITQLKAICNNCGCCSNH